MTFKTVKVSLIFKQPNSHVKSRQLEIVRFSFDALLKVNKKQHRMLVSDYYCMILRNPFLVIVQIFRS